MRGEIDLGLLSQCGSKFDLQLLSQCGSNDNDRAERRNLRFLQSPHCAVNCLQHVRLRGQGAIERKLRAYHVQRRVPVGRKGQLSY